MSYMLIDTIPVWGAHDEATRAQFRRCAADARVGGAALMADGHKGYSMPIGGVIGYRDAVSPSGVGYDISCLVAGTPVTTEEGYYLPIEQVTAADRIICWDGGRVRPVAPNLGVVARGVKPVLTITLMNGRKISLTADHQILTQDGWKEAVSLAPSDLVACNPFIGFPYASQQGELPLVLRRPELADELARYNLYPLNTESPLFPTLVRLLGYVSGDGHISRDGKHIAVYTTSEIDAVDIVNDFTRLGYRALVYRRARHPNRRPEILVRVNSIALSVLFEALGAPVGKKEWPAEPMPWLFEVVPWMRAQFLSAFCSAEMMTPRILKSHAPNLQLKQTGEDRRGIDFIRRLFESLDFEVSVAPSGTGRGARQDYVLQIIGGPVAQARFLEQIGFCYAYEKRVAGAQSISIIWQSSTFVGERRKARDEARLMKASGMRRRDILDNITQRYAVEHQFVHHAVYANRGQPRRLKDVTFLPRTIGEMCWEPIAFIEDGDACQVYDILTGDSAQSFFASGVVVHNCGLKGVQTNIRADDLRPKIKQVMDEIFSTVVFGVGQASGKARDHELFDDPTWRDVREVGKLQQLAREQLGTVGSGNHFVDIFEDENGWVWVGVHFGSRGLGHRTASGFLNLASGRAFGDKAPGEHMDQEPTVLSLSTDLGQAYWKAMELAGRYAYAGRDFVVDQVLAILGAQATDAVHNHHNFAWIEEHHGEKLIVVRKGATPAWPGQRGFIGGSMGDISVIVEGVESDDSRVSLYSTIHGAGRVMSRTQAAGKMRWAKVNGRRVQQVVKPGKISREMMLDWLKREGVELRGAGTDESPHVYRRLPEVLAAHAGTIRILHTLKPMGVAMAGEEVIDPYKD
jgi:tRNA-splicing ligase RtcB